MISPHQRFFGSRYRPFEVTLSGRATLHGWNVTIPPNMASLSYLLFHNKSDHPAFTIVRKGDEFFIIWPKACNLRLLPMSGLYSHLA